MGGLEFLSKEAPVHRYLYVLYAGTRKSTSTLIRHAPILTLRKDLLRVLVETGFMADLVALAFIAVSFALLGALVSGFSRL